jgi:phosphate transport system permease protein
MVWGTAAALAAMLSLVVVLLAVVMVNGLGVFWPARVAEIAMTDGTRLLGERIRSEINPDTGESSVQFKTGNRELDPARQDFRWIKEDAILDMAFPPAVCVLERVENGNFYGYLNKLEGPDLTLPEDADDATPAERLSAALASVREKSDTQLDPIAGELLHLGTQLQNVRSGLMRLDYRKRNLPADEATDNDPRRAEIEARIEELQARSGQIKEQSDRLVAEQQQRTAELRRNVAVLSDAAGREKSVALIDVVRVYDPNSMGLPAKAGHYVAKVGEMLWANPRESNTEGGLFPAIFGTVMMIFLMAVMCFPLGVVAGIYLGEYAKEGFLVRVVRIAVNNLAGIPSIVYGIFGLGFFVYGVGGVLDQWLFPERVAAGTPTFGTGGILWASLTLGLLTVPVVIVSTEEALRAIPRGIREGSLALGATKFQTLTRVLVPMSSPGMMTGFILAMARAAGEVAPLMITGVVKLAPQLPVDGSFPFLHVDRKFMHLGFHIYDVGFQSPNVEASKPMVYVTTLLLLLIVLAMTSVAIWLRNRMRKRYQLRTI